MVGSICRNGQVLVISAHHTVHRYTGTPHHVLSCESQRTPQWVGHHPAQKKSTQKKKINSQLFTTIHNFSHFFTIFHQPSQFCSGFRVVKICENLSHFVKICEMHTPREAPILLLFTSNVKSCQFSLQVCQFNILKVCCCGREAFLFGQQSRPHESLMQAKCSSRTKKE